MTTYQLIAKIQEQFRDAPDLDWQLQWVARITELGKDNQVLSLSVLLASLQLLMIAEAEGIPKPKLREMLETILITAERKQNAKWN